MPGARTHLNPGAVGVAFAWAALTCLGGCQPVDEAQCLERIHLLEFDEVRKYDTSAAQALERLALPVFVPMGIHADAPVDATIQGTSSQVSVSAAYVGGEVRLHDRRVDPNHPGESLPGLQRCTDTIEADIKMSFESADGRLAESEVDATLIVSSGAGGFLSAGVLEGSHVRALAVVDAAQIRGSLGTSRIAGEFETLVLTWAGTYSQLDAGTGLTQEVAARGSVTLQGGELAGSSIAWLGAP